MPNKEMKIRILSFQNAVNFGAVLQAYGLFKTIKDLGYKDVKFLNYNPVYLKRRYLVFTLGMLKPVSWNPRILFSQYLNLPFSIINRYRRNRKFSLSRKHLIEQTDFELHAINDFNDIECNCLICGSDQIWNTWLTGVPDPVFYAQGNYKGLKAAISYASSTELSTFDNTENVRTMLKYLKSFNNISVRELSVQKKLKELTDLDVKLCVDPTILCKPEHYSEIAIKNIIGKPYILVYAYDNNADNINKIIRTIPDYQKYEVHYISFGCSGLRGTLSPYMHSEISIEEFVTLFKYSSYVVTNSFHGLAFSLIFKKNFNVAYVEGLSARCESLLKQIDCYDRFIKETTDIKWATPDYAKIQQFIAQIRKDSIDYLQTSLNLIL